MNSDHCNFCLTSEGRMNDESLRDVSDSDLMFIKELRVGKLFACPTCGRHIYKAERANPHFSAMSAYSFVHPDNSLFYEWCDTDCSLSEQQIKILAEIGNIIYPWTLN